MPRRSRDALFMQIAKEFSTRSTCTRGQVGAVIVKDNHILSHGYNGAPPGQPHCTEVGCETLTVQVVPPEHIDHVIPTGWVYRVDHRLDGGMELVRLTRPVGGVVELGCQRIIHAEANALLYAARKGVPVEDARIYSTHEPCRKCAEAILAAGIIEVYYEQPYRLGASQFLEEANVLCEMV